MCVDFTHRAATLFPGIWERKGKQMNYLQKVSEDQKTCSDEMHVYDDKSDYCVCRAHAHFFNRDGVTDVSDPENDIG